MAKRGFNFTLGDAQIRAACEEYMQRITEPGHQVEATIKPGSAVTVHVTKIRARKTAAKAAP